MVHPNVSAGEFRETMTAMTSTDTLEGLKPTEKLNLKKLFGLDTAMVVHGFKTRTEYVPEIDPS